MSPIAPSGSATITIDGGCFGTHAPYNGTSDFLNIRDDTANWDGGCGGCGIQLNVTKWTDSQIVIAGFGGDYGRDRYYLVDNDTIIVTLRNPQFARSAPAIYRGTVVAARTDATSAACGAAANPTIAAVSPIAPSGSATITIDGSCFGTHAPYSGTSDFLNIRDDTANWDGGCGGCGIQAGPTHLMGSSCAVW